MTMDATMYVYPRRKHEADWQIMAAANPGSRRCCHMEDDR